MIFYNTKPGLMKVWAPLVWFTAATLVVLMEAGIAYGFGRSVYDDPSRWWENSFAPTSPSFDWTVPERREPIDRSG